MFGLKEAGYPAQRVTKQDIRGRTFGCLTALRHVSGEGPKESWLFRCRCGREHVLRRKNTIRPGRARTHCKACVTASITHGMTKHPAYAVWRSMIDRCRLPSHQAWANYGGRGIRVCERWATFENFWADMGPSYRPGLSLDRRDNNEGYSPENCRWVGRKVQSRNKRTNRHIETPWGVMTVSEASERGGVGVTTILERLKRGWAEKDAASFAPDYARKYTTS